MAKLVDERKSPPYMLIIFVFLFLVASAIAALVWNKLEEARKEVQQERKILTQLAGRRDGQGRYRYLEDGLVAEMLRQSGDDEPDRPVIAVLIDREKEVRSLIANETEAGSKEQAEKLVGELRKEVSDDRTLAAIIKTQQQQIASLKADLATNKSAATQADANRKQSDDLAKAKSDDLEAEKQAHAAQIAQRDKEVQDERKKFEQGVDSATKDFSRIRAGLDKNISDLSVKQTDLENTTKKQAREIKAYKEREDPKRKRPKAASLALQPDGKIRNVIQGENICYIDLGRSARVTPGLSFGVYSPTGGPHTGEAPKAMITVTDVLNNGLSVCRIEKPDVKLGILTPGRKKAVVMPNDNIANIAFDATRKYVFVVIGQFQLFGVAPMSSALASDPGADQVAMLVKKFGGTLAKDITPETDFVVIGDKPSLPGQLQPDATDQEKAIHALRLKVHAHYAKVSTDAARMQIPVLNDKRFLALVGYSGRKTLQ